MTDTAGKCPFHGATTTPSTGTQNKDWWPNALNLDILRQHDTKSNPLGDVDYREAVKTLDLAAVKEDLKSVMTTSQDWWPADYGHYGPFFIRLTWHAAGTYRTGDGRGGAGTGAQRFAPLNSWPDNGNLDKARRLLWPIKQKYGNKLSWADLLVLAGNVAIEHMGGPNHGTALGRADIYHPEKDIYWGSEDKWLGDNRYGTTCQDLENPLAAVQMAMVYVDPENPEADPDMLLSTQVDDKSYSLSESITNSEKNKQDFKNWRPVRLGGTRTQKGITRQDLENPLAAVQMGLIYVNPEGPNANPDPLLSAQDVRETFARMAMDDEETFALVAGGHTFGKAHGNGPASAVGVEPESGEIEAQGFGWLSTHGTGKGVDTITSGIEGPWTTNPTQWDMGYLELLFCNEWALTKSPAGAHIWHPVGLSEDLMAPEVDGSGKRVTPMMTTADMALKMDPVYREIGERFLANPAEFGEAFARAWFKLLHRDMGPKTNYVGGDYLDVTYTWQDPVVAADATTAQIESARELIKSCDLTVTQMVETAWASASTFRGSDNRGGANGARIRLEPQRSWAANAGAATALTKYQDIATITGVSVADIVVLAAAHAIESVSGVEVHSTTGRGDATQAQTDVESFALLEPRADGFRNYVEKEFSVSPEEMMLDRAQLLGLNPIEMTVLYAGLRSLGVSHSGQGLFGSGTLDNSWFKTLLSMDVEWTKTGFNSYVAIDRHTGEQVRVASRTDLVFGSNSELRAIAEVYAQDDNNSRFVSDFINAWNKVMNADRFDLH